MDKFTGASPYEKDKIIRSNGRCFKCSNGNLLAEDLPIVYSVGSYTTKYTKNINTLTCDNCNYFYLNQEHVNLLKIHAK